MATSDNTNWQKIRLVSTIKTIDDMSAQVPTDWTAEKIKNFYKSFHKQIGDPQFPKTFNMMLFGKVLENEKKLSGFLQGRRIQGEIKIYVLPDRSPQVSSPSDNDKRLSALQNEALQIVEANQFFYLLSEYLGALVDSYDPRTSAEVRQILLRNFPFMDTKMQELILKYSKFYGTVQDSPFINDNVVKLFDLMGISAKPRDKQAVRDMFYRPIEDRPRNQEQPPGQGMVDRPQAVDLRAEVNRRREELENLIENLEQRVGPAVQQQGANGEPVNNGRVNQ